MWMCASPPNGNSLDAEMNINALLFSNAIPSSDEVNREYISRRRYEKVGKIDVDLMRNYDSAFAFRMWRIEEETGYREV